MTWTAGAEEAEEAASAAAANEFATVFATRGHSSNDVRRELQTNTNQRNVLRAPPNADVTTTIDRARDSGGFDTGCRSCRRVVSPIALYFVCGPSSRHHCDLGI